MRTLITMKEAIAAFASNIPLTQKIAYSHAKQQVRIFKNDSEFTKHTYEEIKQWFYVNHTSYPQMLIINDSAESNFVATYNGEIA